MADDKRVPVQYQPRAQLRTYARPLDSGAGAYAKRIDTSQYTQAADALAGFAPAVSAYLDEQHAEYLAQQEDLAKQRIMGLTFEDAQDLVKSGKIAQSENPWFQAAFNKQFGILAGNEFKEQFQERYRTFDYDTDDFDQFMGEFRKEFQEGVGPNRLAMKGFNETIDPWLDQARRGHLQLLDAHQHKQAIDRQYENMRTSVGETRPQFPNPGATPVLDTKAGSYFGIPSAWAAGVRMPKTQDTAIIEQNGARFQSMALDASTVQWPKHWTKVPKEAFTMDGKVLVEPIFAGMMQEMQDRLGVTFEFLPSMISAKDKIARAQADQYNKANSPHIVGRSADILFKGDIRELQRVAAELGVGVVTYPAESGYTHIDLSMNDDRMLAAERSGKLAEFIATDVAKAIAAGDSASVGYDMDPKGERATTATEALRKHYGEAKLLGITNAEMDALTVRLAETIANDTGDVELVAALLFQPREGEDGKEIPAISDKFDTSMQARQIMVTALKKAEDARTAAWVAAQKGAVAEQLARGNGLAASRDRTHVDLFGRKTELKGDDLLQEGSAAEVQRRMMGAEVRGESPLAAGVSAIAQNGVVYEPWKQALSSAYLSVHQLRADPGNPGDLSIVNSAYDIYKALRSQSPHLAFKHFDDPTAREFFEDVDIFEKIYGDRTQAINEAIQGQANPAYANRVMAETIQRDIFAEVEDITSGGWWGQDAANGGRVFDDLRQLAEHYRRKGALTEDAVARAKAVLEDLSMNVNGWIIYRGTNAPEHMEEMLNAELEALETDEFDPDDYTMIPTNKDQSVWVVVELDEEGIPLGRPVREYSMQQLEANHRIRAENAKAEAQAGRAQIYQDAQTIVEEGGTSNRQEREAARRVREMEADNITLEPTVEKPRAESEAERKAANAAAEQARTDTKYGMEELLLYEYGNAIKQGVDPDRAWGIAQELVQDDYGITNEGSISVYAEEEYRMFIDILNKYKTAPPVDGLEAMLKDLRKAARPGPSSTGRNSGGRKRSR